MEGFFGMARKLRVQYPGAIYHLLNRGDRREDIFVNDEDRKSFLGALGEVCEKTGWEVHAFCLMSNHFHLVIETPQGNLVPGMKWFLGVYTSQYNRRHKLFGHVLSGRYKSLIVDGSGNGYLKTVCDYAHLNPVRAALIGSEAVLGSFPWSSYPFYLQPPSRRPRWLRVDRLLGEWGIGQDTAAGRRRFAAGMEARRGEELTSEFKAVRRGWCLGGKGFRGGLLEQISEQRAQWHYGPELIESAEAKAEGMIKAALKRKGWTETELGARRKGDPWKLSLAAKLRSQTTVTVGWIAEHLQMGARGHVAQLLHHHHRAREAKSPLAKRIQEKECTI